MAQSAFFNATELADFLRQRIKFNNQLHNLAGALSVEVEGHDVVVQAYRATQMKRKRIFERKMVLADAFSTRYLRYLMKKFIVHKELKDFVRPVRRTVHPIVSTQPVSRASSSRWLMVWV